MTTNHEQLDKSCLGVIPNPLKLARALMRPDQPFVMINMLLFKEQATGNYAHLSGQEAYLQYAQSVQKTQAHLGSRLLWSGLIQQDFTAGSAPSFHSIGFLEYASPKTFFQFVTQGGSNTKARGAGLYGQWLIASTTLEAYNLPDYHEAHIVLVELSGGMVHNPEARKMWVEDRKSTYQVIGGKTLWHGRCDDHILGTAAPTIEDVLATWFPDSSALELAMSDSKRNEDLRSIRPYLAYTAKTMTSFMPELR